MGGRKVTWVALAFLVGVSAGVSAVDAQDLYHGGPPLGTQCGRFQDGTPFCVYPPFTNADKMRCVMDWTGMFICRFVETYERHRPGRMRHRSPFSMDV